MPVPALLDALSDRLRGELQEPPRHAGRNRAGVVETTV